MALYYQRDNCRLCRSPDLEPVLSLTPTPPANAFIPPSRRGESQPVFPLNVCLCRTCGHVQLRDIVSPEYLFADYVYVSGTSRGFVEHFRQYADMMIRRHLTSPPGLVIDVGSNDGTLLRFFAANGYTVAGVDPARSIAERATASGIPTIVAFFTPDVAAQIRNRYGPARLVTANNVFAHADDLDAIVEAVKIVLAPDGVFVFEVSYLADVIQNVLFDTIYHEHLSYHTVAPLVRFFGRHGFELIRVERVPTHGGSIRCTVQRAGGPDAAEGSITEAVAHERRLGLADARTYADFSQRIDSLRRAFRELVGNLRARGHTFAGYGAPAKATTLMYHFGIGPETVVFVVDDSPLKQHLLTPGFQIPVMPADELYRRRPDEVIVLAWNFAPAILEAHDALRKQGGHFIIPIPILKRV